MTLAPGDISARLRASAAWRWLVTDPKPADGRTREGLAAGVEIHAWRGIGPLRDLRLRGVRLGLITPCLSRTLFTDISTKLTERTRRVFGKD